MREIKFRAWDGEKMVYLAPLGVENQNRGLIAAGEIDLEPKAIMQFTGLKDKNGKEIYEGDILGYEDPQIGKGEVKYNTERGYFELVFPSGNRNFIPENGVMQALGCEVIGNISQ